MTVAITTTAAIQQAFTGTHYKPFVFRRLTAEGSSIIVGAERRVHDKPIAKHGYAATVFDEGTGELGVLVYFTTQHQAFTYLNKQCDQAQQEDRS